MKLNTVFFVVTVLWTSATSAAPVAIAQHDHSFRNGMVQFVQDIKDGESFGDAIGFTPHRRDEEHLSLQKRVPIKFSMPKGFSLKGLTNGIKSLFGSKASSTMSNSLVKTGTEKVVTTGLKDVGTSAATGAVTNTASKGVLSNFMTGAKTKLTSLKNAVWKPSAKANANMSGSGVKTNELTRSQSLGSVGSGGGGGTVKNQETIVKASQKGEPSLRKSTGSMGGSTNSKQAAPQTNTAPQANNNNMGQMNQQQQPKEPGIGAKIFETALGATISALAMTGVSVGVSALMAKGSGGGGEGGEGAAAGGGGAGGNDGQLYTDEAGNLVDSNGKIILPAGAWELDANGVVQEKKPAA